MAGGGGRSDWARQVKDQIRRRYSHLARTGFPADSLQKALTAGYPEDWLTSLPDHIAASHSGCGFLFVETKPAGTAPVLDLGCGAGLDCLYLAERLSWSGPIFGLDLSPDMAARAQAAADCLNLGHLAFLAGDMENLPIEEGRIGMVTANAAFNLAADKSRAFREAFRVLAPGGQLLAWDLVNDGKLPPEVLTDPLSHTTSLGGAVSTEALRGEIRAAGFAEITLSPRIPFSYVEAVRLKAVKPIP